jgi:hypothetical protein
MIIVPLFLNLQLQYLFLSPFVFVAINQPLNPGPIPQHSIGKLIKIPRSAGLSPCPKLPSNLGALDLVLEGFGPPSALGSSQEVRVSSSTAISRSQGHIIRPARHFPSVLGSVLLSSAFYMSRIDVIFLKRCKDAFETRHVNLSKDTIHTAALLGGRPDGSIGSPSPLHCSNWQTGTELTCLGGAVDGKLSKPSSISC